MAVYSEETESMLLPWVHSPKCKVHQFAFDFIPSTLILTDDCPSVILNRWIVIPVPKYSAEITLMHTISQDVSISHVVLWFKPHPYEHQQIQNPMDTTEVLQDCSMAISRKKKYDLIATVTLLHRRTLCNLIKSFVHEENVLRQFLMEDWES